jgi:hypothetical protein
MARLRGHALHAPQIATIWETRRAATSWDVRRELHADRAAGRPRAVRRILKYT